MTEMKGAVSALLESLANRPSMKRTGDFEKDGILHCGQCGEPRQAWVDWIPDKDGNVEKRLVYVQCQCDALREAEEKERRKQENFDASMRIMGEVLQTERGSVQWDFSHDDSPTSPASRTCRRYIEDWEDMKRQNLGILIYGSKGNGKSFYASCVYNELVKKRVLCGFTSTANLMNILSKWDKTEIIEAIKRAQLLVLDDLGAERETSYSAELMYYVIDERYKTGLPTIVTTNYALSNMEQEEDLTRARIYDRIIEMCPITLKMEGPSRRSGIADERKRLAREIMFGVKNGGNP